MPIDSTCARNATDRRPPALLAAMLLVVTLAGCARNELASSSAANLASARAAQPSLASALPTAPALPIAQTGAATPTPLAAPATTPPPPPILPFDQAVLNAATAVFKNAPSGGLVVIDPLVDGMTGY